VFNLSRDRVHKLREVLEEKGAAAAFISEPVDVFYFSSVETDSLFVPLDGEPILRCTSYWGCDEVAAKTWIKDVRVDGKWVLPIKEDTAEFLKRSQPWRLIADMIRERDLAQAKIGLDPYSYGIVEELRKEFPKAAFVGLEDDLLNLRAIKSSEEVGYLRKAVEITEKAIEAIWSSVEEGVTENHLAAVAYKTMKELGSYGVCDNVMGGDFFSPLIIASGSNSAIPKHYARERKMRRGDILKVDFGARYNSYTADITRTVVFGKASEKQRRIHQLVLECQQSTIEAVAPGVETHAAIRPGLEILTKSEYKDYATPPLGHGIGLFIHEKPRLNLYEPSQKIVPGWVITFEPGIYIPGFGGVRIEDDVLVTDKGHEVLSTLDRSIDALKR
jgi:Xaa-Pro aminopeptidase